MQSIEDTKIQEWFTEVTPIVVFDIESVGLMGEGFACAFVAGTVDGTIHEEFYAACDSWNATGTLKDRAWLAENCLPHLPEPTHARPLEVREAFWKQWERLRIRGCELWGDCHWPVEANFLSACINDDPESRNFNGPFPFHEIATLKSHLTMPSRINDYRENELPKHNPLCDARRSFRYLTDAKRLIADLQRSK